MIESGGGGYLQSEPNPLIASKPTAYADLYSNEQEEQSPHQPRQMYRRGPIEGPPGHQLRRRVTWRSSTYKILAYLYVLGILYIVWLIRDLFWLPFSSSSPTPNSANANSNANSNAHVNNQSPKI